MNTFSPRFWRRPCLLLAMVAALAGPLPAAAAPGDATYGLEELLQMARSSNSGVLAARQQAEGARAAIVTAGAFPNPEIEYLGGRARPRQPGIDNGEVRHFSVTQPLPLPHQRGLRREVAEAGAVAAGADLGAYEAETVARVKIRYYEVLRREAEFRAASEDMSLIVQIRSRIQLRFESGEAPRYELIKADAEMLNAGKTVAAAELRLTQAHAALRQAVGAALPARFSLRGEFENAPPLSALPPLETLRNEVLARNPEIARARAESVRAERQLQLERALRSPAVAIRASQEKDSDFDTARVGVLLTVPLWDQRRGQIAEAGANLARAGHAAAAQEFAILQGLEAAYHGYEIARTQASALEGGILRQAEAALKIAEAAYRFGERGILDYLDAQRVYRAARNDLIAARFELAAAIVEIERLRSAR